LNFSGTGSRLVRGWIAAELPWQFSSIAAIHELLAVWMDTPDFQILLFS
tara:strand:+ start:75479 stop:75625 length:147 start_codon:yes stop_codon:yes gene_type:complete